MPNIIIAHSLEKVIVELRGIMSMERAEIGGIGYGVRTLDDFPWQTPGLREKLRISGQMFIEHQAKRGYEYVDAENIHFYGPYPSRQLKERMLDVDSMKVNQREAATLVRDRSNDPNDIVDFLLVAHFLAMPKPVEYIKRDEVS